MYITDYDLAPRGWICPKCGRTYAPSVPMCYYCDDNSKPPTITTNPTMLNNKNWWDTYLKQKTADNHTINYKDFQNYMNHNAQLVHEDIIGGSDYWDNKLKEWKNCLKNLSNKDFLDWYIDRDDETDIDFSFNNGANNEIIEEELNK